MDAQLLMIAIDYDHQKVPDKYGRLPILNLHIGKEIMKNSNKHWVIPTHYREKQGDKIRQVAIRFKQKLSEDCRLILHQLAENEGVPFIYDRQYDLWYQPACFSLRKNKGRYLFHDLRLVVGITSAGTAAVSVFKQNTVIHSLTLQFVPSSLKIQDYEEMILDLYNIREELVRDENNPAQIAIRKHQTYLELDKQLKQIQKAIQRIANQPHRKLTLNKVKRRKEQQNRFDVRAEIEVAISPGQPKYNYRAIQETTITYENELLKQMLLDLKKYAQHQINISSIQYIQKSQEHYFSKSNIKLQQLIGSLQNLCDIEKRSLIKHKLQKDIDRFVEEDSRVRKYNIKHADSTVAVPKIQELYYVEVTIRCGSQPSYQHEQRTNSLYAELKIDSYNDNISGQYYRWKCQNTIKNGSFNKHFGDVFLNSTHIYSHMLLYQALRHPAFDTSKEVTVVLKGYVRKIDNGYDPVSRRRSDGFSDHLFNYMYLTDVLINNEKITVSASPADMRAFLDKLPVRLSNINEAEEAETSLKQFEKLVEMQEQQTNVQQMKSNYEKLFETVDRCLQEPLFKNILIKKRLKIQPTQLFLHDPNYRTAWQAIKCIENELAASLYVQASDKAIQTAKVEKIFEIWTMYKMIEQMSKQMNWRLEKGDIVNQLDRYLLTGETLQGFSTVLRNREWSVELNYEPKIYIANNKYKTPDIVLRCFKNNQPVGMVIVDMKYRDYQLQGSDQWSKDIKEIAIDKYSNMRPIEAKWQLPIVHSGIIHCDEFISKENEAQFNPYHPYYNEQLFPGRLSQNTAHKYSSIYMTPSQTSIFRNWVRTIFEYNFQQYNQCWNCGEHEHIIMRERLTAGGYPKYHFTCKTCNEFWVKVHCTQNRRHLLVKHTLNYHLQQKKNNRWMVICPCCGDGR